MAKRTLVQLQRILSWRGPIPRDQVCRMDDFNKLPVL